MQHQWAAMRPAWVFLLAALPLLASAGYSAADPVEVPPLVLDDVLPQPETDRDRVRQEAVDLVLELEEKFPQAAHVEVEKHTRRPPRNPADLTEHAGLSYARVDGGVLYRCDMSKEMPGGPLTERTVSSFDGKTGRSVLYGDDGQIKSARVVPREEAASLVSAFHESGLEFMMPFYGYLGFSSSLKGGGFILSGPEWEVLHLTSERLLIRFSGPGGACTFVEFDLRRGGNLVRWEVWEQWGRPEAARTAHLARYELTEVQGRWLPKSYEFIDYPKPYFTLLYTYDWTDLNLEPVPSHFVVDFPADVEVYDPTTLAARAAAQNRKMKSRWTNWQISFWGFFD